MFGWFARSGGTQRDIRQELIITYSITLFFKICYIIRADDVYSIVCGPVAQLRLLHRYQSRRQTVIPIFFLNQTNKRVKCALPGLFTVHFTQPVKFQLHQQRLFFFVVVCPLLSYYSLKREESGFSFILTIIYKGKRYYRKQEALCDRPISILVN